MALAANAAAERVVFFEKKVFIKPPEKYWPCNISKFDVEPPTFCYQLAEKFRNSRGTGWGLKGYAWLGYKYVNGLAVTMISHSWADTGNLV